MVFSLPVLNRNGVHLPIALQNARNRHLVVRPLCAAGFLSSLTDGLMLVGFLPAQVAPVDLNLSGQVVGIIMAECLAYAL